MESKVLKKLPKAPTKKQVLEIFIRAGHRQDYVKKVINEVIGDLGKKHNKNKYSKNLIDVEFVEVVNVLGMPVDYSW
jgi:hypothetical protein